jgi:lipoprotein-releasing system permease protein
MTKLEWSLAWRYLRSRRQSALLSFISMIAVGGVIVGVSALIVIIGVMNGLQIDLREKILLGSPDVRVLTYGELRMPDWARALEVVKAQPGVVAAEPFVLTEAMITTSSYTQGVRVKGIPPVAAGRPVTDIRDRVVEGDFRFATSDGGRRGAVIGRRLADKLGAFVGDTIGILAPGGLTLSSMLGGRLPAIQMLPVTGVFETGMYEYDDAYVYVDLSVARALAGFESAVTGLDVKTTDRWAAPGVAAQLDSVLGIPYRAEDWSEQNAALFSALKLEKFAMTVILLLIVIVAAFNIVSTLTMVVRDKTREIGILKAMGLRARSVRNVFLLQGAVIGLVGTTAGLVIGIAAGLALDRYRLIPLNPQIYFIDHLPVSMQWLDTALIVAASVAIATIATLYPARQAARLYPVEAIRHE